MVYALQETADIRRIKSMSKIVTLLREIPVILREKLKVRLLSPGLFLWKSTEKEYSLPRSSWQNERERSRFDEAFPYANPDRHGAGIFSSHASFIVGLTAS